MSSKAEGALWTDCPQRSLFFPGELNIKMFQKYVGKGKTDIEKTEEVYYNVPRF